MSNLEVNLGWFCPKCNTHWIFEANTNEKKLHLCWKCNTKQKLETYVYDQFYHSCTYNDVVIIRRL
jgi:predicted  nucleic acid-binding Zn ribbon protein